MAIEDGSTSDMDDSLSVCYGLHIQECDFMMNQKILIFKFMLLVLWDADII